MAITGLGPHGSQKAWGTFSAKAPGGASVPATQLTQLGLHGSQRAYLLFVAKAPDGALPAAGGAGTILVGAILTGGDVDGWL
jgi:hypothetical protein